MNRVMMIFHLLSRKIHRVTFIGFGSINEEDFDVQKNAYISKATVHYQSLDEDEWFSD